MQSYTPNQLPISIPLPLGATSAALSASASRSTSAFTSTRIVASVAIVGLSVATMFSAFKLRTAWKKLQTRHAGEHNAMVQEWDAETSSLRLALEESRKEAEQKEKTLQAALQELERARTRAREAEKARDALRAENTALNGHSTKLASTNQQLSATLVGVTQERERAHELLEVRTAELKGAQAYLTKADQLSNAEVIKLVEGLNAEIMQTAAAVAEELAIDAKNVDVDAKEQESDDMRHAYARTEEMIGSRTTELLKASEHHEDPILVQIAIQASFARYTHWMISSWAFESPDDEQMLSEIYERVRETEEQAVSGRWRQLTRAYLQRIFAHNVDLVPDLIHAVCNILVTAGSKVTLEELHARVTTHFGDTISRVVKMSQDLNKQIGEGVTSSDLEALYIGFDAEFNPLTMDDALRSGSANNETYALENILCTTDLGLVRAEKVTGSVGEWKETILLKPKVILFSGISEAIGSGENSP